MRLNAFDYFRAIAIVFIVAAHTIYDAMTISTFADKVFVNLIAGGTALFVFISGFFFHHVFYQKFDYKKFMIKKFQNVYVPYLIISSVAMIAYLLIGQHLASEVAVEISQAKSWVEVLKLYISYLIYGGLSVPFWYIPFIMLIFLLSPLFIFYIKLSEKVRWLIFVVLLVVSVLVQRPVFQINPLHSVLYYFPIYMFGINCSMSREKVMHFIKGKALILFAIALLLAILQIIIYDHVGVFVKEHIFSYNGVAIILIQKVFLILFFLSVLQHLEGKEIPILKWIASGSFAIFFLHQFVKQALIKLKVVALFSFLPEIFNWIFFTSLVIFATLLIAYGIKCVFKKNSRYLIGW